MPKVKTYNVYSQEQPEGTGEFFHFKDAKGIKREDEWHRPVLKLVGRAATFEDAKLLCKNPIMEAA